ncbi:MAG: HNH endonuclease [Mycobacterium sp.]|nr:HNH endonuclease [Mycobacterium sp.]
MARKPCLVCGTPSDVSRCPAHQPRHELSAHQRGLGRAHRKTTALVIAQWVTAHGWICPGWECEPHPVPPGGLTGDHIRPRSTHPHLANDPANYAVLCGPCNTRKGAR